MRPNSALSTPSAASGSPNRRMLANHSSRGTGGEMRVVHATHQPLVGVSLVLSAATSPPTHPTAIPPPTSTTPSVGGRKRSTSTPSTCLTPSPYKDSPRTNPTASKDRATDAPTLQNPLKDKRAPYEGQRSTDKTHDLDLVAARDARQSHDIGDRQCGRHYEHDSEPDAAHHANRRRETLDPALVEPDVVDTRHRLKTRRQLAHDGRGIVRPRRHARLELRGDRIPVYKTITPINCSIKTTYIF